MSSSKSWFAQASSSRSRYLSSSSHDLPRWRTPSPIAAMIPPPIVQSTYMAPAPRQTVAESVFIEKPTELNDREQELQADIQFLLDAQAEALIRDVEGGSFEDRSSTGSTTPTIQSVRSASAKRANKTSRRQPGLRSARKGIYNSIVALAGLKEEELLEVDGQIQSNEQTLEQINTWEEKQKGLQQASQSVHSSEDVVRIQRLRKDADTLQLEINKVELHLMDLKSRHFKLIRQASAVENSVDAKLASYQDSMRLLEEDVNKFLSFKPEGADARPPPADAKASVWQLPPKRRNLDLAREYWNEQRDLGRRQREDIEFEKSALVDGAKLWRETIGEVDGLEKRLRSEVSALPSSSDSQSAWEEPSPQKDRFESLKETLSNMETVIESLQSKLHTAEEHGWRLLMAAIGAELDALTRGKQILAGALGQAEEPDLIETNGHDFRKTDSGDEIRALDQSFAAPRPASRVSDGEDDEPPPELLFSQAIDTE